MEDKIVVTEKKVLEHNEKAFKDTQQLLQSVKEDSLRKAANAAKESGERYVQALDNLHFEKGRVVWVELKVEDSFLSGMLMRWMYSRSAYDSKALHALGFSVSQIMFHKPNGYSPEEIQAIRMLYEKAVGGLTGQ